jgi:hypothetical protein
MGGHHEDAEERAGLQSGTKKEAADTDRCLKWR